MRAPSSLARRAIAHARLRLLATPNTTPVFPSKSMLLRGFRVRSSGFRVQNSEPRTRNSEPRDSLPLFGRDLHRHLFAVAPYQSFSLFARPHLAERVGVVVNVLDRRLSKPNDDVPCSQAGSLSRRTRTHAVKLHTVALIGIVGDCSEINSKAAASRPLIHFHFDERDALGFVCDRDRNFADKLRYLFQPLGIDLVGGVRGFVIVVVSAGEEK